MAEMNPPRSSWIPFLTLRIQSVAIEGSYSRTRRHYEEAIEQFR
jgi:hypothetical protein